jgi:Protein of unknown function (DUF3421)
LVTNTFNAASQSNLEIIGRGFLKNEVTPGLVKFENSISLYTTSGGRSYKLTKNVEFLSKNREYVYEWKDAGNGVCMQNAINVGSWYVGKTTIDGASYIGKAKIGQMGLYYQDKFGQEVLTDQYQVDLTVFYAYLYYIFLFFLV